MAESVISWRQTAKLEKISWSFSIRLCTKECWYMTELDPESTSILEKSRRYGSPKDWKSKPRLKALEQQRQREEQVKEGFERVKNFSWNPGLVSLIHNSKRWKSRLEKKLFGVNCTVGKLGKPFTIEWHTHQGDGGGPALLLDSACWFNYAPQIWARILWFANVSCHLSIRILRAGNWRN